MLDNPQPEIIPQPAPRNKRNFLWTRVILSLIVLTPFALYSTGKISKDWINRSGIILNFLAGFMVAPDLIGISRLKSYEQNLEKVLRNIFDKLDKYSFMTLTPLVPVTREELVKGTVALIAEGAFVYLLYSFLGSTIITLVLIYTVPFFIITIYFHINGLIKFSKYSLRRTSLAERVKEFISIVPKAYMRVIVFAPYMLFSFAVRLLIYLLINFFIKNLKVKID